MPYAKILALLVLMLALLAPVVATADCDTCVLPHRGSWMDNLAVVQLLDNPHDYSWTIGHGSWAPQYDVEWQRHYCGYQERMQACACGR